MNLILQVSSCSKGAIFSCRRSSGVRLWVPGDNCDGNRWNINQAEINGIAPGPSPEVRTDAAKY